MEKDIVECRVYMRKHSKEVVIDCKEVKITLFALAEPYPIRTYKIVLGDGR